MAAGNGSVAPLRNRDNSPEKQSARRIPARADLCLGSLARRTRRIPVLALWLPLGGFLLGRDQELLLLPLVPRPLLQLPLPTLRLLLAGRLGGRLQALHEALHLAGGVHDPLLTGIERMAVRTEVDAQERLGRPRVPGIPTGADNRRVLVGGVNSRLHQCLFLVRCAD